VTLAEIFRRHGPAYLAKHVLSSAKAKVWRAIVACRTVLLGGHVETCDCCGVTRPIYHRVAISNERLVARDDTTVRLRVRAKSGRRVVALPAEEFLDRFLLHVLPSGFKRIRHYGLLAPAAKATHLALARQALSAPQPDPVITASVEEFLQRVGRAEWARCPHCREGRFVVTAAIMPLRQATPHNRSVRGPP
jgi:hypothetical protein